jgi:hypothetical protein
MYLFCERFSNVIACGGFFFLYGGRRFFMPGDASCSMYHLWAFRSRERRQLSVNTRVSGKNKYSRRESKGGGELSRISSALSLASVGENRTRVFSHSRMRCSGSDGLSRIACALSLDSVREDRSCILFRSRARCSRVGELSRI